MLLVQPGAFSEEQFDRPYFARDDRRFRPPTAELTTAVAISDLIFIGLSSDIDKSSYDDIHGGGHYTSRVRIEHILKGSVGPPALTLSWKPSATNVEENARHIFFAKTMPEGFIVRKEIYVFKSPAWCRTYGAYDGGRESTLGVINALLSPTASIPPQLIPALFEDLQASRQIHRQATAIRLMCELSQAECIPLLTYAVEHECEEYLTALYALCKLDGKLGVAKAADFLRNHPKLDRWQQASVFDAIVAAGSPESVDELRRLGEHNRALRVSCAFAIKDIAPAQLPQIAANWIADAKVGRWKIRLLDHNSPRDLRMSDLLTAAVESKKEVDDVRLK